MAKKAKICRGSWCFTFGFDPQVPLETVVRVLSAFGYDGIELAGFHGHATLERYPDRPRRRKLAKFIDSHGLEIAGYAPGPYGDFGRLPWATGDECVVSEYEKFFTAHLKFCADCGIPAMRIDPGTFGPLSREADYRKAWDRVVSLFRKHAEAGAKEGVLMLWELETSQIFVKPSETVKLLKDVGHPNLKLLYDTGHCQACVALGHNQSQPAEILKGGQVEFLGMLTGQIGHVHLCDNDNSTWHNAFGSHLGFGKGILDFDAILQALVKAGYRGPWWSVDAIPMTTESWTDTWDGKLFLEKKLSQLV